MCPERAWKSTNGGGDYFSQLMKALGKKLFASQTVFTFGHENSSEVGMEGQHTCVGGVASGAEGAESENRIRNKIPQF